MVRIKLYFVVEEEGKGVLYDLTVDRVPVAGDFISEVPMATASKDEVRTTWEVKRVTLPARWVGESCVPLVEVESAKQVPVFQKTDTQKIIGGPA